jgi:hypothetical protein
LPSFLLFKLNGRVADDVPADSSQVTSRDGDKLNAAAIVLFHLPDLARGLFGDKVLHNLQCLADMLIGRKFVVRG